MALCLMSLYKYIFFFFQFHFENYLNAKKKKTIESRNEKQSRTDFDFTPVEEKQPHNYVEQMDCDEVEL